MKTKKISDLDLKHLKQLLAKALASATAEDNSQAARSYRAAFDWAAIELIRRKQGNQIDRRKKSK
jgi:hypothetical protein